MQKGLPAKRFDVWRRLYERFLLEPDPAKQSRAEVGTLIVPVTQVDVLLLASAGDRTAYDLTAASGTFRGLTVPAGERWYLGKMERDATSGNTRMLLVVSGFSIHLNTLTTTEQFYDAEAVILDVGDQVGIITTGNAGDGSRVFALQYRVEARA